MGCIPPCFFLKSQHSTITENQRLPLKSLGQNKDHFNSYMHMNTFIKVIKVAWDLQNKILPEELGWHF